MTEDELAALVGTRMPGGTRTLEKWWVTLVLDAMECSADDGASHPTFVFLVATGSMGWTWNELFDIFAATEADGPMFGETNTSVHTPLQTGETYTVRGEIVSAARKTGKKTGVFDIVGYRLDVLDAQAELVASTTNSIVFPRRVENV
ncbi:hypothetical protein CH293_14695 [Rhodococcus sp. 14-2470-1b]|uniref:hypothetical protein n=1 Tax=Rhodococcus sp. 14-2470-1b TaxID=2023149 RepID=UPI000B9BC324|nr:MULTISPECIES: hypothetical protein [unclassified Rhodococcus (in: high G+C Gram-positive bacteria)]OZF06178.1 hypothetical protein CH300_13370 [Rhodococcus sp. 15-1154-1]OZF50780.1 hypothetical protein CH293_14695 [Rhodococcus sp. 14-2470-1b]